MALGFINKAGYIDAALLKALPAEGEAVQHHEVKRSVLPIINQRTYQYMDIAVLKQELAKTGDRGILGNLPPGTNKKKVLYERLMQRLAEQNSPLRTAQAEVIHPCTHPQCLCTASYNGEYGEHCCNRCRNGLPCTVNCHQLPSEPTARVQLQLRRVEV